MLAHKLAYVAKLNHWTLRPLGHFPRISCPLIPLCVLVTPGSSLEGATCTKLKFAPFSSSSDALPDALLLSESFLAENHGPWFQSKFLYTLVYVPFSAPLGMPFSIISLSCRKPTIRVVHGFDQFISVLITFNPRCVCVPGVDICAIRLPFRSRPFLTE